MKLKVPRVFNTEAMNEHELLFCWFLGKFFDRYGWDQEFTIDSFDAKIILKGQPKQMIAPTNFKKALRETLDISFFNENRLGIKIKAATLADLKKNYIYSGKITVGPVEVEVTSKKVILLYTYLLGILGVMDQWTYESDSPTGLTPEELEPTAQRRDTRITSGFELNQLLNALD